MSALNRRSPDYLSKMMHFSMENLGVRHNYLMTQLPSLIFRAGARCLLRIVGGRGCALESLQACSLSALCYQSSPRLQGCMWEFFALPLRAY